MRSNENVKSFTHSFCWSINDVFHSLQKKKNESLLNIDIDIHFRNPFSLSTSCGQVASNYNGSEWAFTVSSRISSSTFLFVHYRVTETNNDSTSFDPLTSLAAPLSHQFWRRAHQCDMRKWRKFSFEEKFSRVERRKMLIERGKVENNVTLTNEEKREMKNRVLEIKCTFVIIFWTAGRHPSHIRVTIIDSFLIDKFIDKSS